MKVCCTQLVRSKLGIPIPESDWEDYRLYGSLGNDWEIRCFNCLVILQETESTVDKNPILGLDKA